MGRISKKNESIDLNGFIKLLILIIVIIIFSYVIQGLTYLFELINQYKLMLGIVSVLIIVGAVILYRKNLLNSSFNKPSVPYYHENIIDVTPITVSYNEQSRENPPIQTQEVKRLQPIMIGNKETELAIESKSSLDTDFNKLVEFLESPIVSFVKRDNKKEKDYQDELWGQLKQKFYDQYPLQYEAQMGRHRLDILFNNSIGIELKVHWGNKNAKRDLYSQLSEYMDNYPKMIGLVINCTNENDDIIKQDIEKLISKALEKDDYKIIIK